MAELETDAEDPPKKSKLPLILGLLLALVGGGGGFYATWSGMVLASDSSKAEDTTQAEDTGPGITFVEVEPLVISLGATSAARHLRFRASLEVPDAHVENVTQILPRVTDVLNSYLRALDPGELEDRSALTRLRAQMLRRVQVVVGQNRVSDLLVLEFVLN
ncbi:MAG: flagellar basal body-associated FliL family protein [Pseudomonadota bacterium]